MVEDVEAVGLLVVAGSAEVRGTVVAGKAVVVGMTMVDVTGVLVTGVATSVPLPHPTAVSRNIRAVAHLRTGAV
ncbi:MAG TPA: hypothetical protein QGI67_04245 [Acidimicrobiales bacterium]|nr:hypothetical protein [Acidimicrobiales bacterium]